MKNSPLFSVLTASLNNGLTIERTLESVKNQSFQDFEHIVIDGGSRDETLDIFKEYENTYNLQWISEPDHGISDALNKGLRISSGRYIIVIQADDQLLHPNILDNVFSQLKSEKFDIISFPVILGHPDRGKVLSKPIQHLWWNHFKFIFRHQGCFVHKRIFDQIGIFRNEFRISLDYDFFYRALARNCSVKFGKIPVALMGGEGIGSNPEFILKRLKEERLVQVLNEKNISWRLLQFVFHMLYLPYKIHFFSKFVI
jgi:glycosyltransferase involved in cell wall biosynthesis